jgi:hypothetical protein
MKIIFVIGFLFPWLVWSQKDTLKDFPVKDCSFFLCKEQVINPWEPDTSWANVKVQPDILVGNKNKEIQFQTGLSIESEGKYKRHWYYYFTSRLGVSNQAAIPYESLFQTKSFVYVQNQGNQNAFYADFRGSINYRPNNHLTVSAGMDRPKIGAGDRSLFSGDQGISNPFLKVNINFEKWNYSMIQQVWREKSGNHFIPKGSSTHALSFSPFKKWNFLLFETVIYQMKDTLYNRGFEVEYLNPFIFYRPQEYNMGSADNILLGIQPSYQLKKGVLYGQILIDDFLLSAYKAHNKWWANKFGLQIGIKGSKYLNDSTFSTRYEHVTEMNLVRPFTYSQVNKSVVYGNQGLSNAHPLGSNFIEVYHQSSFIRSNGWSFQLWLQGYIKGKDFASQPNLSYGGDIYKSYKLYAFEFNNRIGQGETMHVLQVGTQISKTINRKKLNHFSVFIEPRFRLKSIENNPTLYLFFCMGIQSNFWKFIDRRNY